MWSYCQTAQAQHPSEWLREKQRFAHIESYIITFYVQITLEEYKHFCEAINGS